MRKMLYLLVLFLLVAGSGLRGGSDLQVKATNPPGPFTIRDTLDIGVIGACGSALPCTCSDQVRGIQCGRGYRLCMESDCSWYAIE